MTDIYDRVWFALKQSSEHLFLTQDPDTGVALDAHIALLKFASRDGGIQWLLSSEGCLTEIAAATTSGDSLERLRALALLVNLSNISQSAAEALLASGVFSTSV